MITSGDQVILLVSQAHIPRLLRIPEGIQEIQDPLMDQVHQEAEAMVHHHRDPQEATDHLIPDLRDTMAHLTALPRLDHQDQADLGHQDQEDLHLLPGPGKISPSRKLIRFLYLASQHHRNTAPGW